MNLKTFFATGLLALLMGAAGAVTVPYSFGSTDDAGRLVPGATVAIGSTVLTPGTPVSVPASAGERILSTGLAPAAAVTVTLLDYGTGDYGFIYDAALYGEMYFPLTISKAGSTITNRNALVAVVCTADSSTALTTAAQTTSSVRQADMTTALNTQGLTASLVSAQYAAMLRVFAAEWGPLTRSGNVYSVAMPTLSPTIPAPGSVVGTVTPSYDSLGHPTNTNKTVN